MLEGMPARRSSLFSSRFPLFASLILLVGGALRIVGISKVSLWTDELYTNFFARSPAHDFFHLLWIDGVHTPLYFALMRLVPPDAFLLRSPSILAALLGTALFMRLARYLLRSHAWALLAGLLLACNPYHVWLSRMARPYALFFLTSLLASYAFWLILKGRRSAKVWIFFWLSHTAVYLTHYFAVLLPLAQFITLFLHTKSNSRTLWSWFGLQFLAGLPLLAWVIGLSQQEGVGFGINWIKPLSLVDLLLTLWNLSVGFLSDGDFYLLPAVLAATLGVFLCLLSKPYRWNETTAYAFWLILAPLIAVAAVSLTWYSIYHDRFFMLILPALLLLILWGWRKFNWGWAPILLIALSGTANIVATLGRGEDQREDWQATMAFIGVHAQPEDSILYYPLAPTLQARYYFEDPDWMLDQFTTLEDLNPSNGRVWVIYQNVTFDAHRQGVLARYDPLTKAGEPLAEWLQIHQELIVLRQEFNGVTIFLLESDHLPKIV